MEQQDRSSLMMRIEQAAVALLHGRPTRRSQGEDSNAAAFVSYEGCCGMLLQNSFARSAIQNMGAPCCVGRT